MSKKHKSSILGQPIQLEMSPRYFQFNRQQSIRDVYDGLVELITNSDDSYHRLYTSGSIRQDGGLILITYLEQRKGQPSITSVRDRAEGMTLEEMVSKLATVGARRSEIGDRGFMARGARDCTELGDMTFESIKGERYHACQITQSAHLIPLCDGERVDGKQRESLGVTRGNGTVVTIKIDPRHKMPRISTLVRDLPWHFALRDIMSEDSWSQIYIRNENDPQQRPDRLVYRQPQGEEVVQEEFEIPGYPGIFAQLVIWKAPEPLEDGSDRRFRRAGLLVKGQRAIHECSFLFPEFDKDPYALRYFGRIECAYIDTLLQQYDECRERGSSFPDNNPCLLIDPNRQTGLMREHPFTNALFQIPSERLRALIAYDREAESKQRRKIANEETERRLNHLAKAASQFMKEQVEDYDEPGLAADTDPSFFHEKGMMIVPTYVQLAVGEEKRLYMYVKKGLVSVDEIEAVVEAEKEGLTVLDPVFLLTPHPRKEDRLVGKFGVRGDKLSDGILVRVTAQGLPPAEAIVTIADRGIEKREFADPLEFEYRQYSIRERQSRTIRLYAKYPNLVSVATPVKVWSDNDHNVAVLGSYEMMPVAGTNYARADITLEGRRLNTSANVHALVNGRQASALITVKQQEHRGVPLDIEIRDQDFESYRSVWASFEGKPNLLLISARHKSLKRYLGAAPQFEGQNSPIFRLLLAEIVAESVARKALELEAQSRPWDFDFTLGTRDVVMTVLTELHKKIRDFVAVAHEIMLTDRELSSLE